MNDLLLHFQEGDKAKFGSLSFIWPFESWKVLNNKLLVLQVIWKHGKMEDPEWKRTQKDTYKSKG
jgi:hypothetical protein